MGFAICMVNSPVVWSSKMQEQIAMSTMEAEYNTPSQVMKTIIPLRELLTMVAKGIGLNDEYIMTFQTAIWEDHTCTLTIANLEPGRIMPRSKYYAV